MESRPALALSLPYIRDLLSMPGCTLSETASLSDRPTKLSEHHRYRNKHCCDTGKEETRLARAKSLEHPASDEREDARYERTQEAHRCVGGSCVRAVDICQVAGEYGVELDGREAYERDGRHRDVGRDIGGDGWDCGAEPPETDC